MMDKEKIIELAREAGLAYGSDEKPLSSVERFATLIEREVRGDAEPPPNKYNEKRIAWELERTAMGDGYYGNALYVAMDMAQTTASDRQMLHRYMHGANLKTDHVKLQDLAMRIYNTHPTPTVSEDAVAYIGTDGNLGWLKKPVVLYDKAVPLFVHPAPDVVRQLVEALQGMFNIAIDSQGVAGYHQNGEIAEWDDFEEIDKAKAALAAAKEQGL